MVDDLRQGAIEVEEECGPVRRQHGVDVSGARQSIRQGGHPAVDDTDRDLRRIIDDRVGTMRGKGGGHALGGAAGDDPDDDAEPGSARRCYTGFGTGDDDGATRPRAEAARGVEQCRRLAS